MNTDQFKQAFIEESLELLDSLEDRLLEMEEAPDDEERISAVFRIIHTIKGSAAMFGFDEISSFTHHVETILDALRKNQLQVSRELIDWTLKSGDHINALIEADEEQTKQLDGQSIAIINEFKKAVGFENVPEAESAGAGTAPQKQLKTEEKTDQSLWRIKFRPAEDVFLTGTNPLLLLEELFELGEYSVTVYAGDIPPLEGIDPEKCYTGWDIFLLTDKTENDIRDVFIFVESESALEISNMGLDNTDLIDGRIPKLGEILINRGDVHQEDINSVLGNRKKLGQLLSENKIASEETVDSALKEQNFIKTVSDKRIEKTASSSIRVNSDKLDELVNLVGELVTIHARIHQESTSTTADLHLMVEQLGRITENLRENTMSMRLLPIGTTFSRFKRLVRDLSNEMGKQIDLLTSGEETELDKTVIEKLNDPLVHLIRNSIDHGIESPEDREAKGKKKTGTVKLKAEHSGASVRITIEDDGAGLNRQKILSKAAGNKLIGDDEQLTDEEIYGLIFQPGFSTAEKVTNVSGRGVGMDVVKRQIDHLNGTIKVESRENEYTRIILSLPLTLAIIDGFLVNIGDESFIFPLSSVEACIESKYSERIRSNKKMIPYRGTLLPYIDLREEFRIQTERPEIDQIVVVSTYERQVGFCVDKVIGEHQTVIKSLSGVFNSAQEFSGATILGNGRVALILDTDGLLRKSVLLEENTLNEQHNQFLRTEDRR